MNFSGLLVQMHSLAMAIRKEDGRCQFSFPKCCYRGELLTMVHRGGGGHCQTIPIALRKAKAGRPARTYIQQLCEDTGCNHEDLPEAMNNREKRRERVRDICAGGTTWWRWWWRFSGKDMGTAKKLSSDFLWRIVTWHDTLQRRWAPPSSSYCPNWFSSNNPSKFLFTLNLFWSLFE